MTDLLDPALVPTCLHCDSRHDVLVRNEEIRKLRAEVARLKKHLGDLCTAAATISDEGRHAKERGQGRVRDGGHFGDSPPGAGWVAIDCFDLVAVHEVMRKIELEAVRRMDDSVEAVRKGVR